MDGNLFYRQTLNNCGECKAGNRYYAHDEFLKLWNDGGYGPFFRNWAIVCSL
ncbi:MAG: hypothetical protein IIU46_00995 [Treponema sp.]|nr:hypothetical protein [Treponema sp.]